ncbi:MAG: hypothetical protein ABGY96_12485 [bacterium]|nr:hypothetical protein [Gammaproteobacteria bacterium]HIL96768.1 hypothetical protein [Pseudomonadales bacterium]
MPKLVLIGGPTGVGKTSALNGLKERIAKSAILDADDVWRISEDLAVAGTRHIAIGNVIDVMHGYYDAGCEVGILSWVFARPELYEPIISGLGGCTEEILQIYLVATPKCLEERLSSRGDLDRLEYAKSRLELIENLLFPKIDTSGKTKAQVVDEILQYVQRS